MWFEKNDKNLLSSILVQLNEKDCISAFKYAYNRVIKITSMLTFFYRRPCKIGHIKIYDNKYELIFQTSCNYCPTEKKLVLPKAYFSNEVPFGSLLAIYREGMNSVDLAYRYISFFKIYESWYYKDFAFKLTDNCIKNTNISRPLLKITKELLQDAYAKRYHKKLLDRQFDDDEMFTYLKHIRHQLSHYLLTKIKEQEPHFRNLDNITSLEEPEANSNLVERIATTILDIELLTLSKCDDSFKAVYEIYKDLI